MVITMFALSLVLVAIVIGVIALMADFEDSELHRRMPWDAQPPPD